MNQRAILGTSFCMAVIEDLIAAEKTNINRRRKLTGALMALRDAHDMYPGQVGQAVFDKAVKVFEVMEEAFESDNPNRAA